MARPLRGGDRRASVVAPRSAPEPASPHTVPSGWPGQRGDEGDECGLQFEQGSNSRARQGGRPVTRRRDYEAGGRSGECEWQGPETHEGDGEGVQEEADQAGLSEVVRRDRCGGDRGRHGGARQSGQHLAGPAEQAAGEGRWRPEPGQGVWSRPQPLLQERRDPEQAGQCGQGEVQARLPQPLRIDEAEDQSRRNQGGAVLHRSRQRKRQEEKAGHDQGAHRARLEPGKPREGDEEGQGEREGDGFRRIRQGQPRHAHENPHQRRCQEQGENPQMQPGDGEQVGRPGLPERVHGVRMECRAVAQSQRPKHGARLPRCCLLELGGGESPEPVPAPRSRVGGGQGDGTRPGSRSPRVDSEPPEAGLRVLPSRVAKAAGRAQRRPEGDDVAPERRGLGLARDVEQDPPGGVLPRTGGGVRTCPEVDDQAVSFGRAAWILCQRSLEPARLAEGGGRFRRREGAEVAREPQPQEGGGPRDPQAPTGKACQDESGRPDSESGSPGGLVRGQGAAEDRGQGSDGEAVRPEAATGAEERGCVTPPCAAGVPRGPWG